MTDKPNSYVLGKGRLYFEPVRRPAMHPALGAGYEATVKLSEDIYEWFVNEALFDFRVISIVGYNPQMLLPAPSFEDEFMQSMTEWAAEQMKLPYATVAAQYLGVDFETSADRRYYPLWTEDGQPNVERWNDADATPIEDIRAWIGGFSDAKNEPFVLTQTMYDAVQAALRAAGIETNVQMVTYMHAAFVHESDIGDRKPVGKIELFDYDDHTVITLEGSGELPGRMSISDALFQPKVQPLRGKQPSYLDHDPTKRHKRRKQHGNPHKR